MSANKAFQTTGIGSLNTTSIDKAVAYSLKHDLAFLPQLPSLEGDMIAACLNKSSLCLDVIQKSIKNRPLKIQIPGPLSSKLSSKDILSFYDYLKRNLTDVEIITFIDAPYFPHISHDLLEIIEIVRRNDKVGLHCCGHFDIKNIEKLNLDYFSYDYELCKDANENDLLRYCENLVLGIIPTMDAYNFEKATARLMNISDQDKSRILLSASCGLADKKINTNEIFDNLKKTKSYLEKE